MSDYSCWNCGAPVAWIGDSMESEVSSVEENENDRVVGYYRCPECGSDYEFRQGNKENN